MNGPPVTVVIPCYNAEKWVARAIESALRQTHPNVEIVVVDDGSTDRSLQVIQTFSDRIKYVTGPNRKVCAARNRGIGLASSDYVLFLDADDYLPDNAIANLVSVAQRHDADIVIGSSITEEPDGTRFGRISYPSGTDRVDLACGWVAGKVVQTGGLLWRKDFINEIGLWDESESTGDDEEIAIRAFLRGGKFHVCNDGTVIWCNHENQQRISRRPHSDTLGTQFKWVEKLLELHLEIWGEEKVTGAFGQRFYLIAKRAFQVGCDELAERSLKRASELGFRPEPDLSIASVARAVLGMRRQERLTYLMKDRIKRSGWLWRPISQLRSFRRRIYQR